MKFTTAAVLAAASSSVLASPLAKRAVSDLDILNFALTLEHLEYTFYTQGLNNYTAAQFAKAGFSSKFYSNLQEIQKDEMSHVAFLTGAITAAGGTPVPACNYDFGVTTAKGFISTASVLEGVGVSAYLGAAALIAEAAYLTAAGSILTTESRHSAFIRNSLGESPFATPYDIPLGLNEVYTLAGAFITSCPYNQTLPVKAFPSLSIANAVKPVKNGDTITVMTADDYVVTGNVWAAWPSVYPGTQYVSTQVSTNGREITFTIPDGIDGQVYVVLTKNKTSMADPYITAGPAALEVTPSYELS